MARWSALRSGAGDGRHVSVVSLTLLGGVSPRMPVPLSFTLEGLADVVEAGGDAGEIGGRIKRCWRMVEVAGHCRQRNPPRHLELRRRGNGGLA